MNYVETEVLIGDPRDNVKGLILLEIDRIESISEIPEKMNIKGIEVVMKTGAYHIVLREYQDFKLKLLGA